jgi:hypothetical protein
VLGCLNPVSDCGGKNGAACQSGADCCSGGCNLSNHSCT